MSAKPSSKDSAPLPSAGGETCFQGARELRVPKGGHPNLPCGPHMSTRGLNVQSSRNKGKSLESEEVIEKGVEDVETNDSKDVIPDYDETPLDVLESMFERYS